MPQASEAAQALQKSQSKIRRARRQKRAEWLKNTLMGVPDWVRRALRLSVGLLLFGLCGRGLIIPRGLPLEYHDEYQRSCVWAGVTAIVVNAPLIGRMAQTSAERVLGTLAGGAFGFVVYDYGTRLLVHSERANSILLTFAAAAVGGLSCYLAAAWKLDMTPRFFAMTFLLVTMGAPAYNSAFMVAVLRTGGILAGVMVMQLLAILILPKSATVEAIRDLQKALVSMCEMSDLVWTCNELTAYHINTKPATPRALPGLKTPREAPEGPGESLPSPSGCPSCGSPTIRAAPATPAVKHAFTLDDGQDDLKRPLLQDSHLDTEGHDRQQVSAAMTAAGPGGSQKAVRRAQEGAAAHHVLVVADTSVVPEPAASKPRLRKVGSTQSLVSSGSDMAKASQDCEKALAAVYTALASCEDNMKLSSGEIYLWHFWGHYIFLPGIPKLGGLFSWSSATCRWHLDATLVSNMGNSLRRLSRLLWNIQLCLADEMTPEVKDALLALYPADLLSNLALAFSAALQHLAQGWFAGKVCTSELQHVAAILDELQATSDANHRSLVDYMIQVGSTKRPNVGQMTMRRHSMLPPRPQPSGHSGSMPGMPFLTMARSSASAASAQPPMISQPSTAFHATPDVSQAVATVTGSNPTQSSAMEIPGSGPAATKSTSVPGSSPQAEATSAAAAAAPEGAGSPAVNSPVETSLGSSYLRAPTLIRRWLPLWGYVSTSSRPGSIMAPGGGSAQVAAGAVDGNVADVEVAGGGEQQPQDAVLRPVTAEGHIAQVRWASFEWLVGEVCDELEETYAAAGALLASLPHPL